MNKQQKEVLKHQLNSEERQLKWLNVIYEQAAKDTAQKIAELSARKDMENLQSIIYQKKYQEALQKQIQSTLDDLHKNTYSGISDYLNKCYETGYVGAMYDLHGQGIPIVTPIDQKQIVRAMNTKTKLSQGLYNRLGEDTRELKKTIRAQISRGIANGSSWNDVAENLAKHFKNTPFNKAKNNSMRIVRTEGHRIQMQSQVDAQQKAVEKGARILKQWDATLDDSTRESHQMVDGEIRELDEPFSNGLMFPSDPDGAAEEVINCRCALLQRAEWGLDANELQTLQDRAEYFGLDKTENFENFKEKYLNLPDDADNVKIDTLDQPVKSEDEHYNKCIDMFKNKNVEYNHVEMHTSKMSEEEIINALAGGDKTSGSCASVGFAYIGQKQGWNVLDFRGGESMEAFRSWDNLKELVKIDGLKVLRAEGKCSLTVGNNLLKMCEEGKEYYLVVGRHASIVRKTDGVLQYLELQSATKSGWTDFNGNPKYTLNRRFGCTNTSNPWHEKLDFMIDIKESKLDTDEIKSLMGYINTAVDKQMKGVGGNVK